MLHAFQGRIPTIKEKIGVPEHRAIDLQPFIDTTDSEKIYKIRVRVKKKGMTSNVDPNNLTYYN